MNANELRIGNLVRVDNKITIVTSSLLSQLEKSEFIGFDTSPVKPELLTKKWLLKLGFKKTKRGGCVWVLNMPNYDATIQLLEGNIYMSICRGGIAAYHFHCEYIHQLQNIYFTLTGGELGVK